MNNACEEQCLTDQLIDLLNQIRDGIINNDINSYQLLLTLININNHTENNPITLDLVQFIDHLFKDGIISENNKPLTMIDFSKGPILNLYDLAENDFDETKNLRFFHHFSDSFNSLLESIVRNNTKDFYQKHFRYHE